MKEVLRVPLASALALQFNAFFTLQASEVEKKTAPGESGPCLYKKMVGESLLTSSGRAGRASNLLCRSVCGLAGVRGRSDCDLRCGQRSRLDARRRVFRLRLGRLGFALRLLLRLDGE
jgi:hypothetical protein